jgi:hypothetical protein
MLRDATRNQTLLPWPRSLFAGLDCLHAHASALRRSQPQQPPTTSALLWSPSLPMQCAMCIRYDISSTKWVIATALFPVSQACRSRTDDAHSFRTCLLLPAVRAVDVITRASSSSPSSHGKGATRAAARAPGCSWWVGDRTYCTAGLTPYSVVRWKRKRKAACQLVSH